MVRGMPASWGEAGVGQPLAVEARDEPGCPRDGGCPGGVVTPRFIGEAIRFKREEVGLSARALSLRAGLSPAYVHKLEAGLLDPSLAIFARLAIELDMAPDEAWVCLVMAGAATSLATM